MNRLDDERADEILRFISRNMSDRAYVLIYCEPGEGGRRDTGIMSNVTDAQGNPSIDGMTTIIRWAIDNLRHDPHLVQTYEDDQG